MSDRVTMPALGESVTEGTVTRWLKQVGDDVAVDEPREEHRRTDVLVDLLPGPRLHAGEAVARGLHVGVGAPPHPPVVPHVQGPRAQLHFVLP